MGDDPRSASPPEYSPLSVLRRGGGAKPVKGENQTKAAEQLIYRLLEDGGGETDAKVAYAAGEDAGIPQATMRRARQNIGVAGGAGWKLTGLPVG